ncbi:MAG: Cys-rich peptide radical SAM maturase CcpM [bacterium]|nr:Cys-rich peptide radical SAM maturase CcpM [bacterium]
MMNKEPIFHLFSTHNRYYIYDLNINSIVEIDKSTSEDLHEFKKTSKKTKTIIKLENMGILLPRNEYKMVHPADDTLEFSLKRNLKTMALQITQNCNLRCQYCVYSGTYSNRSHSNKKMSKEIAFDAIDFFLQNSMDSNDLNIGFYGGEPLIEFDFIKKCMDYANQKSIKPIAYNLTTNATLLHEYEIEYLLKNEVNITISLDGPQEIQDERRVYASQKGTFDDIYKVLILICEKYPEHKHLVKFNAVASTTYGFNIINDFFCKDNIVSQFPVLINYQNSDNTEEVIKHSDQFFDEHNYEFFKILMEKIGRLEEGHTSKLLFPAFSQIKEIVHDRLKVNTGNVLIDHHSGPCVVGKHRLFVSVSGDFFPCEKVSETSNIMNIGNIYDGFDMENMREMLNIGKLTEEECRACWAFRFCPICVAKADDNGKISKKKKLSHCSDVRIDVDKMLKNYCFLREFNYEFTEGVMK